MKSSSIISNINWPQTIRRVLFVFVTAVIFVSVWLTLSNINSGAYASKEATTGKIMIDVSVSDTLTRGMDDKLNRVLQDLLQIRKDSLAVEVRKVHNGQQ